MVLTDLRVSGLLLALLALIALAVVTILIPAIPAQDLPTLERTIHAQNAHKEQAWNPDTIIAAMASGNCGPVDIYRCPDDTYIYTCQTPGNPAQLLGLVIGATDHRVITGLAARAKYWTSQVGGCTYMGPGAMP